MPGSSYLQGLSWLGHASFRWEKEGTVIYMDPFQIDAAPHDGKIILISHSHFDHLDPESVMKVAADGAVVVAPADCIPKLREAGVQAEVKEIAPGQTLEVRGVRIEGVPAYNLDKDFHLKESGWVGFVVTVGRVRLYHAGDTDFIPEMEGLEPEVALLPVSGAYVMTASQAAAAAQAIRAKVTVPMHYGAIVGSEADARRLREEAGDRIIEILEKTVLPGEEDGS
ncbi:MAG: Zn-dependent hydrolase [Candidatus Omnitrophica bacterium CG11_big_fil_rev_8_21_14_0_20_64_10]|nr:MAG: Zn-dependent hydrolase [Candidatus Omnitrophica bacterium CG11_big_fil_rev_8_21_14_0_20_64_10]